ncbi:mannose-6-phosphate isomerase, class I [Cnuibacter sp. UC19_7]|uniref:mannose-6-phosphate isomerase, class I n=1 Tax=Cnuibacter sp. UC19_7 TaxID=3350166 RepID=UPI00366DCEEC
MLRIDGVAKTYDWGSREAIPALLGREPDGRPIAEVWYGAHPTAPSPVPAAGETLDRVLAERAGDYFPGGASELAYLLKLLAPGQPVSLQVHPSTALSAAGFADENSAGVPLDAPHRTFKDPHAKPEMVFAVTPFRGMVGFRPLEEAVALLAGLESSPAPAVLERLRSGDQGAFRSAFEALVLANDDPGALIEEVMARGDELAATVGELAGHHPGDAGALAPLLLSVWTLEPGEALFVPAGVPHAYLSGIAVELMANSDNVVRAGLTRKHVDRPALLAATDFDRSVAVERPLVDGPVRTIAPEGSPLRLVSATLEGATALLPITSDGPAIVLGVSGRVQVATPAEAQELAPGDAVVIAPAEGAVAVSGTGQVVAAFAV